MSEADNSVDKASFFNSIPDSHQPTFTLPPSGLALSNS